MKFIMKTKNESHFKEVLQAILDEYEIFSPNNITIHRDTSIGQTVYVLTEAFIYNLNKLNPDLVKRLQL